MCAAAWPMLSQSIAEIEFTELNSSDGDSDSDDDDERDDSSAD